MIKSPDTYSIGCKVGAFSISGRKDKPLIQFLKTITEEMGRGNFSFLILAVGILQLIVMLKKRKDH